jgi:hypothetical protein
VDVAVREQVLEVVVDAGNKLSLGWARVGDTVAAALVDDLVGADTRVAAGVAQTATAVQTWVRGTVVDHLFAHVAGVAVPASA